MFLKTKFYLKCFFKKDIWRSGVEFWFLVFETEFSILGDEILRFKNDFSIFGDEILCF